MGSEKNYKFNKFWMDMGRVVLSPLILFFRVKKYYVPGGITGEEVKNLKGALIAANHVSFADPFILNAAFAGKRFFYTTSEEVMTGLRGKLLSAAGCVRIDRTSADFSAIKKCASILKDGYFLGMFPQGHIGGEGVKGGMVLIAAMTGATIIPAYIEKRTNILKRQRLVLGKPIVVSDICRKKMPDKSETEEILKVFDERCSECRKVIE